MCYKKILYSFFLVLFLQNAFLSHSIGLRATEVTGMQKVQFVTGLLRGQLAIVASQVSNKKLKKKAMYASLASSVRIVDALLDLYNHRNFGQRLHYIVPWLGYDLWQNYQAIRSIMVNAQQSADLVDTSLVESEALEGADDQKNNLKSQLKVAGYIALLGESFLQAIAAVAPYEKNSNKTIHASLHGLSSFMRLSELALNSSDQTTLIKTLIGALLLANAGCLVGDLLIAQGQREIEWQEFLVECERQHRLEVERLQREAAAASAAAERVRLQLEYAAQQAEALLKRDNLMMRWNEVNELDVADQEVKMLSLQEELLHDRDDNSREFAFAVLGLFDGASVADIKKAYRKLSRIHHVDKHNNSAESNEITRRLNAAHEVLKKALEFT